MASTLLGPVTDADLRRWQMMRHALLGDLLQVGLKYRLTPITWRISVHAVVGDLSSIPTDRRRAVFDAWVSALELDPATETETDPGTVQLRASAPDEWRGHRGELGIWATIIDETESES